MTHNHPVHGNNYYTTTAPLHLSCINIKIEFASIMPVSLPPVPSSQQTQFP